MKSRFIAHPLGKGSIVHIIGLIKNLIIILSTADELQKNLHIT